MRRRLFPARCRGSAAADVVMLAAVIVFVLLPLFSFIAEKYILLNKAQMIKDAVDMTNISVYDAIAAGSLGRVSVEWDREKAEDIFRMLLKENLKLDASLDPLPGSIAEGRVLTGSIEIYTGGFPVVCPDGVTIGRPSVHSSIIVPVRPSLYRGIILKALGKEYVELKVHVDSEIPLNN